MKRYPEYKDSGIEWIGEIPNHWELTNVGRVSILGRGRVISAIEIINNLGEYPVYSSQTENNGVMGKINSYDFDGEYVTWTTDGANAGTVFHRTGKFNCTNVCGTIQPKDWEQIDLRFLPYFLNLGTKFSVRLDINPKLMNNMVAKIPFVIPPKKEQIIIATFLDHKTHQIDDLITKKQKLIELLQEERNALINHAVTKGLDPAVPMKDSGIEWLGNIPEHWGTKRLKFLVDNIIEKSNISDFKVALENIESWTGRYLKTDNPSELTGEMKSFEPDDILFNKLRPYLAKVYLPVAKGDCVGELLVLRSKTMIVPKFLYYRLLSRDFIEVVNSSTYGAKMPRACWEDFIRNLIIPFPNITEQEEIVKKVDHITETIGNALEKLKNEIELISEYKTSLINEAVTGKIDIRNYVVKNHYERSI